MAASKKKSGMVQLNTSVPAELKKDVQRLALDLNLKMTEVVSEALKAYLGANKLGDKDPGSLQD